MACGLRHRIEEGLGTQKNQKGERDRRRQMTCCVQPTDWVQCCQEIRLPAGCPWLSLLNVPRWCASPSPSPCFTLSSSPILPWASSPVSLISILGPEVPVLPSLERGPLLPSPRGVSHLHLPSAPHSSPLVMLLHSLGLPVRHPASRATCCFLVSHIPSPPHVTGSYALLSAIPLRSTAHFAAL